MRFTKNSIHEIQPGSEIYQFRDHLVSELWLEVHPTGKKNWYLHLPLQGKEKIVLIGPYPKVDLGSARKTARGWLREGFGDTGHDTVVGDDRRLLEEQKRVKLSQVIKDRQSVKFRPNPLFQDWEKSAKKASDLRFKEAEERKFFRQKQEEIEIETAWTAYQQTKDPSILSDLLRSENMINNPLPAGMIQEIAYILDQAAPQSYDTDRVYDDRIFMTYWRHTELKNGVEPLLMDLEAISECVTFMEAIGCPIPYENIEFRIKSGYTEWREKNAEKLEKSAKVLQEMKNQPAGDEDDLDDE